MGTTLQATESMTAAEFRRLRVEVLDLSQIQLAEKMDLSERTIQSIEALKGAIATRDMLAILRLVDEARRKPADHRRDVKRPAKKGRR